MKKNMRNILYDKINNYKKIDLSNIIEIEDLENLNEGIFRLNGIPSVNLLKKMPFIFNSTGEVGLLCIEKIWLMTISKNKTAFVPSELNGYIINGGVQFFAHSHPGNHTSLKFPSFSDMNSCDAIDHCIYIIHYQGITEVDISNTIDLNYLNLYWNIYLINEKVSKNFYDSNQELVYDNFFNYLGCKKRIISFDNEKEIQNLLQNKMNLHHSFWDKEAGITPYPGKRI